MRKITTICAIALMCLTSCEKDTFLGFEPDLMEEVKNVSEDDSTKDDSDEDPSKTNPTNPEPYTPTPTEIPANWGQMLSASVSAVPADDDNLKSDKKILVIATSKGVLLVPFDRDILFPEKETIINANLHEGNFEGCNSGYYNKNEGSWTPATAVDSQDRLEYLVDGVCKRNLRFTTLESVSWDWQNIHEGGFSTHVSQYDVVVENNQFFIFVNGEQVFELR